MMINVLRTIRTEAWLVVVLSVIVMVEVSALNGSNVCMVKQKYNITKRVKYRAPMSVRTYEWCFSMPPRCSKWSTEIRDLTRLETEERTAEVAVCCPGYKMRDVSCVPICPDGKTGTGCSEDCPANKWGPNCINECKRCKNGFCSPVTGECECVDGWQGESCDASMPPATTAMNSNEGLLTTLTTKLPTSNTTPKVTTTGPLASSTKATSIISSTNTATSIVPVTVPKIAATPKLAIDLSTTTPAIKTTTIATTKLSTTTISATTKILNPLQISSDKKIYAESTSNVITTELPKLSTIVNSTTFTKTSSSASNPVTEETTKITFIKPVQSIAEDTDTTKFTQSSSDVPVSQESNSQKEHKKQILVKATQKTTITSTSSKDIMFKTSTTNKETTIKFIPSTPKSKPKEIWIRPALKGESPIVETKIKMTHDIPKYRSVNNKELTPTSTTTKTIIVSIIPTSISYSTFKKIALTSSYLATKNTTNVPSYSKIDDEFATQPMSSVTVKPTLSSTKPTSKVPTPTLKLETSTMALPSTSVAAHATKLSTVLKSLITSQTVPNVNRTNSMVTEINNSTSISITDTSPKATYTTQKQNQLLPFLITKKIQISTTILPLTDRITKHLENQITLGNTRNVSSVTSTYETNNMPKVISKEIIKSNITNNLNKMTTGEPADDEEFHILTEPEHITAVMGDKGTERTSVDLISVIGIAGGVMMAVITVAVVIVMIERCKKPRYEEVRKINDIRMQVMIDNNDGPPPYVRNIFHTPLPEPPSSEKCHYQPISTLDRNLKQFMRPVVVQTISPLMLENFRGILECHYDHLPRRSNDFGTIQTRSSVAPSLQDCGELSQLRASMTESAIEAMKCEAKLDVIDSTTSEPLYAEIPCWRPPSEHAIEILNMNGEAVTEL